MHPILFMSEYKLNVRLFIVFIMIASIEYKSKPKYQLLEK